MADTVEKELVRDVSEKLCYIALVYDTELTSTAEAILRLASSQTVTSSPSARVFPLPEVLVQPSLLGKASGDEGRQ